MTYPRHRAERKVAHWLRKNTLLRRPEPVDARGQVEDTPVRVDLELEEAAAPSAAQPSTAILKNLRRCDATPERNSLLEEGRKDSACAEPWESGLGFRRAPSPLASESVVCLA